MQNGKTTKKHAPVTVRDVVFLSEERWYLVPSGIKESTEWPDNDSSRVRQIRGTKPFLGEDFEVGLYHLPENLQSGLKIMFPSRPSWQPMPYPVHEKPQFWLTDEDKAWWDKVVAENGLTPTSGVMVRLGKLEQDMAVWAGKTYVYKAIFTKLIDIRPDRVPVIERTVSAVVSEPDVEVELVEADKRRQMMAFPPPVFQGCGASHDEGSPSGLGSPRE